MDSALAKVVVVGRMNVGKSTLFNRLSDSVKSLTLDYEGVTRDILRDTVTWAGRTFELIDTGGISFKPSTDPLQEQVRLKALKALEEADVVLFVVDGIAGVVGEDLDIAQTLRGYNKKIIVVVNKGDSKRAQDNLFDFYQLPSDLVLLISAQHGQGISDLLDAVLEALPRKKEAKEDRPLFRTIFLGRPNVGKSSLMNAILKEERAIVSDIPGTTREALSERVIFHKEHIQITDTAGIRRKRAVEGNLESMMVKSSMHALKDAHIVILMIDMSQGALVDQELKLAFYAFAEHHKGMMILLNKSDLKDEETDYFLKRDMELYDYFLRKVPVLSISCKTGKNVGRVIPMLHELWERYSITIPDEAINRLFISNLQRTPLMHKKEVLRVYKVRQTNNAPLTITLGVNEPAWFGDSQKAFFENILRENYDLQGVPVKFIIRKGEF